MAPPNQRHEWIEQLRVLPRLLEDAVRGLQDPQLDTPYRDGGWTVRQVVHHLADSHMNAFIRLKLMLTEDTPTLKPYDQDLWAVTPEIEGMDVGSSIAILRGLHERWALLLERLPADAWERKGMHPERGEMNIERLVTMYAGHGERHVGQILGLRRSRQW
jgi:hypothetical protein